jgi:hypothetical protein
MLPTAVVSLPIEDKFVRLDALTRVYESMTSNGFLAYDDIQQKITIEMYSRSPC